MLSFQKSTDCSFAAMQGGSLTQDDGTSEADEDGKWLSAKKDMYQELLKGCNAAGNYSSCTLSKEALNKLSQVHGFQKDMFLKSAENFRRRTPPQDRALALHNGPVSRKVRISTCCLIFYSV